MDVQFWGGGVTSWSDSGDRQAAADGCGRARTAALGERCGCSRHPDFVCYDLVFPRRAGVAQLVEQLIRNQQVLGSSPSAGSKKPLTIRLLASRQAVSMAL
jgi:hypothetical protein